MTTLNRFFHVGIVLILFGIIQVILPFTTVVFAQTASPLIVIKHQLIDAVSPVPSGIPFKLRITYECSGSTGTGCDDVVITTTLPPALEQLAYSEDTNVASFTYNQATGQARWVMKPLPLGTTGQFELSARFRAGTTLDGTSASIVTTATSSNVSPRNPTALPLEADAANQARITKTVLAAGTVGSDTVYRVNVCSSTDATGYGALNLTNVRVVDTLPAGATFVFASPAPSTVAPVGGRTQLTWAPQDIMVPACAEYTVRVSFPAGTNAVGDTRTNDVQATLTPFGGTSTTLSTSVASTLPAGLPGFQGTKSRNLDYAIIGSRIDFGLSTTNTGTTNLTDVQLIDAIPVHLDATSINTGRATSVAYQKNGVTTWIPGVPLGTNVAVTSFPGIATGDYVSALRFTLDRLPVNDTFDGIHIYGTVLSVPKGGESAAQLPFLITNTMTGEARANGATVTMNNTASATVDVDEPKPRPTLTKIPSRTTIEPANKLSYTVSLENRGYDTNNATLDEPVVVDLLPAEVSYTPGSWALIGTPPAGCATPTFTTTPNYGGSGRTLLQWNWNGTGCALAAGDPEAQPRIPGDTIRITYQVDVGPGLAAGTTLRNRIALIDYDNDPPVVKPIDCTDTTDKALFVANGVDATNYCSVPASQTTVLSVAQIASAKFVKGQLDTSFSRDPLVGRTVRGGDITFAVVLTNTGNIDVTAIQIIDLLPFNDPDALPTSNQGTRDQAVLGSAWTPYLAKPIEVTPAIPGLSIYYSTEENPCRSIVVDSHPDATCTPMTIGTVSGPGVWSSTLPADPTTIRSLWFQFPPAYRLERGKEIRFEYAMVAPDDAPLAGAGANGTFGNNDDTNVAWNTFAYRVSRADDGSTLVAQPPRVGIEVIANPTLASFGNYIWHDRNQDGVQNDGAASGANGATVRLYTAGGTLVGTRITGYDAAGNPGYYSFGGLTPGDYYAEFTLPDGYAFANANQGGDDALDSDGAIVVDATTRRTATETLTAGENNLTYDQGLTTQPVSLGNRVWFDTNNNSLLDGTEQGISAVQVDLFFDRNNDGVLTGFEQDVIATTTTNATGYYLFTKQDQLNGASISPVALQPGAYIVGIRPANFSGAGPLVGYWSSGTFLTSAGTTSEAQPARTSTDIDSDDNGLLIRTSPANTTPFYLGGVLSPATLIGIAEPTGEIAAVGLANQAPDGTPIPDARSNETIDFGFYTLTMGSLVWNDSGSGTGYNNGQKDADETGMASVRVQLYAADGTTELPVGPDGVLGTADDATGGVLTQSDGSYTFRGLADSVYPDQASAGYVVKITAPMGFVSSTDAATTAAPSNDIDESADENGIGTSGGVIASATGANAFLLEAGETGATVVIDQAIGQTTNPTVDFGLVPVYSIGNRVWYDTNNDGLCTTGESGVGSVRVDLYAADVSGNPTGTRLATQTTTANGYYLFTNLYRGDYVVVLPASNFAAAQPLHAATSSTGSTNDTDIDNDDSGRFGTGTFNTAIVSSRITLGAGDSEPTGEPATPGKTETTVDSRSNVTVDFGFYRLTVGNLLWYDVNNDGLYQSTGIDGLANTADDEKGIAGVVVELYDATNTMIAMVTTDANGLYTFNHSTTGTSVNHGLAAGIYTIRVPASEFAAGKPLFGFSSSLLNAAAPDPDTHIDNDDNATPNGGGLVTLPFSLTAGPEAGKPSKTITNSTGTTTDTTVDVGVHTMSLGNLVWNDLNNDGVKDAGEPGIDGVTVRLYDDANQDGIPDGTPRATETTSNGGHYLFAGLPDGGAYVVELVLPAGFTSSTGQHNSLTAPAVFEPGRAESNLRADDNRDHGTRAGTVVRSGTIVLTANSEPAGETDTAVSTGKTNLATDTNTQFTIDFGLYTPLSLGNMVWIDANNDGIYQTTETMAPDGVIVDLYWDADGSGSIAGSETTPVRSTTTSNGLYLFDTLVPGGYRVGLNQQNFAGGGMLAGYISSTGAPGQVTGPYEGAATPAPDTNNDGDDNGTTVSGEVRSGLVSLSAGNEPTGETPDNDPLTIDANENLTLDFGIFLPASLGDYLWRDPNRNGVQDATETGIDGVTVRLYDGATLIATVVTGDNPEQAGAQQGFYRFINLEPNKTYTVRLDNPADTTAAGPLFGHVLTGAHAGGDDTADSDATLVGGFPAITATTGTAGTMTPTYDVGVYPVAALGDYVWRDTDADGVQDATEDGIDGVTVRLYTADGADGIAGNADDTLPVATTLTGDNPATPVVEQGSYTFTGLRPATTYTVRLDNAADYTSGPLQGVLLTVTDQPTTTNALDSDAVLVGGFAEITAATTGTAGTTTPTYDLGFFQPAALGDYVWHDSDGDGVQDATEDGIDGVTVRLYTANGADGIAGNADDTLPAATTLTGDNPATPVVEQGSYTFTGLRPATTYTVRLDNAADYTSGPLQDYLLTARDAAADDTTDSDARIVGGVAQITMAQTGAPGSTTPTYDIGFTMQARLGDYVWEDLNRNGTQDAGEMGIDGITVNLYAADGTTLLGTSITGDDPATSAVEQGFYAFDNLLPNTPYVIRFDRAADYTSGGPLFGYIMTGVDAGSDTTDSDATLVGAVPTILARTDAERTFTDTFDVGFYGVAALGDYVWEDQDRDGAQDAGEPGIKGVTVNLYAADGTTLVATTVTGDNPDTAQTETGFYLFTNLFPNTSYIVRLDHAADRAMNGSLAGLVLTDANATGDTSDSDATLVATTPTIAVTTGAVGSVDLTNDIGFIKSYAIGNRLWFDTDNDGQRDAAEQGIGGVVVELYRDAHANGYDPTDTKLGETTTNSDGSYRFSDLIAGTYTIVIAEQNFVPGGMLDGYWSSLTAYAADGLLQEQTASAPDTDRDNDDQGTTYGTLGQTGGVVASGPITLGGNATDDEPVAEPDRDGIGGGTPDARTNTTIDFGFYTATLGDQIWHDRNNDGIYQPRGTDTITGTVDDETGIAGVAVELWRVDSTDALVGGSPLLTTTTTLSGTFHFTGLLEGRYRVRIPASNFAGGVLESFRSSTGGVSSTAGTVEPGISPNTPTDGDDNGTMGSAGIESAPYTLTPGTGAYVDEASGTTNDPTIDFGLYQPVQLGNLVFLDSNNSGTYDLTETGIAGVQVQLYRDDVEVPVGPDGILGTADDAAGGMTTDTAGQYLFQQLTPGTYVVRITPPTGYRSSTGAIGTNQQQQGPYEPAPTPEDDTNNDDNGTQSADDSVSLPITLVSGGEPTQDGDTGAQSNLTIDFGLFQPARIGSMVFVDSNGDGIRTPDESGLAGVTVTLYAQDGTPIATTTTEADGAWAFTMLPEGIYTVGFSNLPPGSRYSPPGRGNDRGNDSDVDPSTGRTDVIVLRPGEAAGTIFVGVIPPAPTAVSLVSFSARIDQDATVVRWVTAAEIQSLGFHVYRSATLDRASARRITDDLILAHYPAGGIYMWKDTTLANSPAYYWLEEVATNGATTVYGPATAMRPMGDGLGVYLPLIRN